MSLKIRDPQSYQGKLTSFTIVNNGRPVTLSADEFERVLAWYKKQTPDAAVSVQESKAGAESAAVVPTPAEWENIATQPTRIYTVKNKSGMSEVPDEVAQAYYSAALSVMRKYGGLPLPPQADVCKELGIARPRGETMQLLYDKLYHLGYIDRLSTAKSGTSQWAWLGIPLKMVQRPTAPPFKRH